MPLVSRQFFLFNKKVDEIVKKSFVFSRKILQLIVNKNLAQMSSYYINVEIPKKCIFKENFTFLENQENLFQGYKKKSFVFS